METIVIILTNLWLYSRKAHYLAKWDVDLKAGQRESMRVYQDYSSRASNRDRGAWLPEQYKHADDVQKAYCKLFNDIESLRHCTFWDALGISKSTQRFISMVGSPLWFPTRNQRK